MRILVTGASGYVGSRLIPHLLRQDYEVRAAVRSPAKVAEAHWLERVELVRMDVGVPEQLAAALRDVDVAYYLLHAMDGDGFVDAEREQAESFARAAADAGVGRIVYLGGIAPGRVSDDDGEPDESDPTLSAHLRSRLAVERALGDSGVPVVVAVRAGILLGGGSTSFELVRRLVEGLPVIPLPRFMDARLQPIAIADALAVLVAAAHEPDRSGHVNAVGPDTLSYAELVARFVDVMGLRRAMPRVPSVPFPVISLPATWVSRMPGPTVRALVPSMAEDLVTDDSAWGTLSSLSAVPRTPVAEAIRRSLASESPQSVPDDDYALRLTDPEWVGGDVVVRGGRPRRTGTGWLARLRGTAR
ncbi:NAD(P)H-binding protein [Mycetocola reblochoni]|uniref:Nucleoside-diphosphate-sugar epimerase n=2 Tax=Mycetocola reblochoni TaxID=331618 RepID=A0A1R4IVL4_9MICO|nr:NAD(P)H-binding protein [Mycetocola reblochoni]RLP70990.1 NAD-dependent epimerase/dehydratase family protein [Mycetocola reblochoni]SJN23906.1 Nucleoside-diphosphate-sugar epimerase [Mycetocola reblochoni REB411]